VGPEDVDALTDEPGHEGQAVAAVAADTIEQARAAVELIDVEWDVQKPLLDPEEAADQGQLIGEASRYERGDVDRALAQADVVVEAEYRTQTVLHSSFETHQSVCEWRGDSVDVYISTQFIFGVRDEVAGRLGLPPDKVRVVCEFMGGGFGSKNGAGDYVHRDRAGEAPAVIRCALAARGEPRHREPQRHDSAADQQPPGRRDLLAARGRVRERHRLGRLGGADRRPGCSTTARTRARSSTRRRSTPPMKAFRAPGFVEGRSARVLLDELAGEARPGLPRAAAPQLRELVRRQAVLVEEPDGCTAALSSTGSGATRCGREARGRGNAASASQARSGTAAAVRPRMPGCGSAPTGARR
jgi:xanthine dehydrogenase YagR molybdenum-binding subunit